MAETKKPAAKKASTVKKAAKKVVTEPKVDEQLDWATETFADGADAVADHIHHVAEVSRGLSPRQIVLVSGAVVVGVAVGGYVGYRFAEKRLSTKFEQLMEDETVAIRKHYDAKIEAARAQNKPDLVGRAAGHIQRDEADRIIGDEGYQGDVDIMPPADADTVIQNARDKAAGNAREAFAIQQANEKAEKEAMKIEAETVNIFQARDEAAAKIEEWDYAKELKSRDPRYPYIIHVDEFNENSSDYDIVELTYYEGDEVLTNERDQPLPDAEEAIGIDHLGKFGHGSADPLTVYIRNDVREVLYDVTRSPGLYSQEVHGIDPDPIRHSYERRPRRMKFDDD